MLYTEWLTRAQRRLRGQDHTGNPTRLTRPSNETCGQAEQAGSDTCRESSAKAREGCHAKVHICWSCSQVAGGHCAGCPARTRHHPALAAGGIAVSAQAPPLFSCAAASCCCSSRGSSAHHSHTCRRSQGSSMGRPLALSTCPGAICIASLRCRRRSARAL